MTRMISRDLFENALTVSRGIIEMSAESLRIGPNSTPIFVSSARRCDS